MMTNTHCYPEWFRRFLSERIPNPWVLAILRKLLAWCPGDRDWPYFELERITEVKKLLCIEQDKELPTIRILQKHIGLAENRRRVKADIPANIL